MVTHCEHVDVGILCRLALQVVIDLLDFSVVLIEGAHQAIDFTRITITDFLQLDVLHVVIHCFLEGVRSVFRPRFENRLWSEGVACD